MGFLGRRFGRYFLFALCLLPAAVEGETEDSCGESVAGALWLPSSTGSQALVGKSPAAAILAVASRSETEHQLTHIKFIAGLYGEYKSDFDEALASAPAGLREVVATKTAEDKLRASITALIKEESRLGEAENKLVSNYFCAHIDDMTGNRLRALLNALVLQTYLTRFDEAFFNHVTVFQKDRDLDNADYSEATNHASQALFDLPLHLRFLGDLHRIVPMSVMSVQEDRNGRIADAYVRASQLEIRAAEEKASALALSPNVPDSLSHFIRGQISLRQALPKLATHPILIEWVRQTEEHLR